MLGCQVCHCQDLGGGGGGGGGREIVGRGAQ